MKKITPVNGHIIVDPVPFDDFMQSSKQTYSEIGVVVAVPREWEILHEMDRRVKVGERVYFDSWMAAKFPKEGEPDGSYWLIKWEDVRAVEYAESPVSE